MKHHGRLGAVLICLLVAACGGSSPTSPTNQNPNPNPNPAPGPTPSPSAPVATWTTEATLFTNGSMGISGTMADTTTLRLNDGRWRMFLFAGQAYRSAISTDGVTFTMEPGNRLPEGNGHSRVVKLDDGRVRMFHITANGISSSISTDEGMTFTLEGERITAAAAGLSRLSGPAIVRLPDGRWRMYFSELDVPGAAIVPLPMKSATSSDQMTWTMDPGVRVGPGATLSGSAAHPAATIDASGTVIVYFFRNADLKLYAARSSDGLNFTAESIVLDRAADPDIVVLPGGTKRMYYNWFDASTGVYTVSSATGG